MKTYSAEDFRQLPARVYRHADKDGKVLINHRNYDDVIFELTARPRGASLDDIAPPLNTARQIDDHDKAG